MSGQGKKVCVTGASGYIASWLVKLLLSHGYTVNATVRNPRKYSSFLNLPFFCHFKISSGYLLNSSILSFLTVWSIFYWICDTDDWTKVEHLLGFEGAHERLNLFKADLMEEGSFDSAISGCDGVFHTASPLLFTVTDPQVILLFLLVVVVIVLVVKLFMLVALRF